MSKARPTTKAEGGKAPFNAIEHLNRLADQHKAEKHPNVPAFGRVKSNYNDDTTNGLTACVMAWMRLNRHYCPRVNTGGIYDEKLKKYRPSGATVGVPDLIGCINGIFVGIEINKGSDKMSPEKKENADQIRASLGHFIEVRSFQQFYDWYGEFTRPPFA